MQTDEVRAEAPPRPGRPVGRLIAVALAVLLVAGLDPLPSTAAAAPAPDIDRQSPAVVHAATTAMNRYRRFVRLGTPERLVRFERARRRAAGVTAVAMGLDVAAMRRAWRTSDRPHQVAVLSALTQLGVPYRSGMSRPHVGFDCSGLTSFAWRRAGHPITRSSGDQIDEAAPRVRSTALAGDLVYYPGHVMLYLGIGTAIVHASDPEDDVELAFLRAERRHLWGNPIG